MTPAADGPCDKGTGSTPEQARIETHSKYVERRTRMNGRMERMASGRAGGG